MGPDHPVYPFAKWREAAKRHKINALVIVPVPAAQNPIVVAGPGPAMTAFLARETKTWTPGTSPGMTNGTRAPFFECSPIPSIIQLDLRVLDHRPPFVGLRLQEGGKLRRR